MGTLPLSSLIFLSSANFLLFPALPYVPIFLFGVYLFLFSTNSCLCLLQSPAGNTILHWLTSTISFISWPQQERAIGSMLLCICWDAISYECLTLPSHGVSSFSYWGNKCSSHSFSVSCTWLNTLNSAGSPLMHWPIDWNVWLRLQSNPFHSVFLASCQLARIWWPFISGFSSFKGELTSHREKVCYVTTCCTSSDHCKEVS